MKIKVLEVSQFIETKNLADTKFEGHENNDLCKYKEVDENDLPDIGNIWLTPNKNGMCEIYKVHYDTSG